ncbi:hypothetical protein BDW59DRAFT_87402 [Aspergillus cavernicola]|uniref:Uncharacterized protein n=1 Tax=Aspergillus cavernicola TaxID=176166 RepID=A0ABR4IAE2_9EURO
MFGENVDIRACQPPDSYYWCCFAYIIRNGGERVKIMQATKADIISSMHELLIQSNNCLRKCLAHYNHEIKNENLASCESVLPFLKLDDGPSQSREADVLPIHMSASDEDICPTQVKEHACGTGFGMNYCFLRGCLTEF